MNSIMQALLGSSRFCQLLMALKAAAGELAPAPPPTLAALAQLAAEFPPLAEPGAAQPASQQEAAAAEADAEAEEVAHAGSGAAAAPAGKAAAAAATKAALLGGTPLHPHMLSEVVNAFRPLGGSGTPVSANIVLGPGGGKANGGMPLAPRWEQEDAHDFLEYLVDRMHLELLALARADTGAGASAGPQSAAAAAAAADAAKAAAEDEWLTKSGRRLTKRQQLKADSETAVSALFRGTYVSTVTCAGHPPSETPEPFVSPTLHILSDGVKMVEDALDELTGPETISGYRPQDHLPPMDATKALRLQRLPPLLVLYLMRFDPANRHQKISKHVGFPPRLKMNSRWLAADSRDRAAEYELIATVTHHGKTIAAGHYTADVKQPGGQWMRFDDGQVFFVSQQQVLVQRPYLLFYQRVA
ncbi:hypothetical protein COHA_010084 [Chlorella ohadii]|uniref:ubiquitinyl hydrolase 1 n=1 Tax=Chlorella ohadii TaxID=2649997 RepID=A0AAD5DGT3_9CHLO|nr:hypothetical protein COHA_010084 [Chlorella ohadii]